LPGGFWPVVSQPDGLAGADCFLADQDQVRLDARRRGFLDHHSGGLVHPEKTCELRAKEKLTKNWQNEELPKIDGEEQWK
jgi:hypothetical protein